MADILEDGESYLPPKFLFDDDDEESYEVANPMLPFEFSYDFDSNWVSSDSSSPVESVFGSTETESDDEDFLAELARQIAYSSLVNEGLVKFGSPHKPSPSHQFQLTNPNSNPDVGFYPNQSLSYQKLQTIQFQRMREHQMLKEQQATAQEQRRQAFVYNGERSGNVRPMCSSWYSLQQAQQQQRRFGLGMRSMFLGNPGGGNRSCAGTGVFIPRNAGNPCDSRKIAPATQPTRVAQTLNLNVQEMDLLPHNKPSYADFTLQNDPGLRVRNNNLLSRPGVDRRPVTGYNEFKLPQEWTY